MITSVEIYRNGDSWVVAWLDLKNEYPQRSEKFYSKRDAENKKKELEV